MYIWYFIFSEMFKRKRVIPFLSIPNVYLNLGLVKEVGLIHLKESRSSKWSMGFLEAP